MKVTRRRKINFKAWTPVVDAQGYCKLPSRTIRKEKHNAHVNCYIMARLKEGTKDCHNIR